MAEANETKPKTRRNAFVLFGDEQGHEEQTEEEEEEEAEEEEEEEEEPKFASGSHLTGEQVSAFKEVFDLFDSNGGGTIDAEELDLALRSVEIQLSQEEIIEVLMAMDKDGNGEIDFSEFLHLMTNTERFLEGLDSTISPNARRRRETMLFEALTQFMKRSALHSINEIVGFYHTKYKRIQAPHVVGHYAAGARLIGLTETQLRKHMETLKANHAAGDEKSPYAEPLHIVFGTTAKKKRKKRRPSSFVPARTNGRIRLKFTATRLFPSEDVAANLEVPPNPTPRKNTLDPTLPRRKTEPQAKMYKRNGWLAQRIQPFAVKLPMPKKTLGSGKEAGKLPLHGLTFDDLPAIRDKRLHAQKHTESEKHWEALGPSHIHSDVLRNCFRLAFNAYTPYAHIDKSRVRPESKAKQGRSKSVVIREPQTPIPTRKRASSSIQ